MKLAVLLISHNRIKDVKISMKIIRHLWSKEKDLNQIDILHCYNGDPDKYPRKYLEDKLIRRPNLGHFQGATDLINTGLKEILDSKKNYKYVFVMSGDVWLVKPKVLVKILKTMTSKNHQLATSLWPDLFFIPHFFATEFFIITPSLAKKVFPLKIKPPFFTTPRVEEALTNSVLNHLSFNQVYLLPGRKLFWGFNRHYSPKLGYLSHHDLVTKQKLAKVAH